MNRFPLWKYLLLLGVLAISAVYALPNLFAPDPAIQVTPQSSGTGLGQAVLDAAGAALDQAGIPHFGSELSRSSGLLRLRDREQQLAAKQVVQQALGFDYVVALNLAPTTPAWLTGVGAKPMKLGLDLSGGVHFLLEVDTADVLGVYLNTKAGQLRDALRATGNEARYRALRVDGDSVLAAFDSAERRERAAEVAGGADFRELLLEREDVGGRYLLRLRASPALIAEREDYAVDQNLATLRNRVNELGVSEPIVQRQGRNRIVVQLPGVQDTAEAKRIIGKTANLEFRLEASAESAGREQFPFRNVDRGATSAALERSVVISGDRVVNAASGYDENGQPQVNITLDGEGGRAMSRATRDNIGRRLGVLFVETRQRTEEKINEAGVVEKVPVAYQEKGIISLATIQSALGVQFRITGLQSPQEASELALLLRAGALAAPMKFVEESTIGPSLGAKNIEAGVRSGVIGLALVMAFMLIYYRVFGIFANLALIANTVILIALMSIIGATLTLPGIAGTILTMGMAVDANVLIYSRIREELRAGQSPQGAITAGYDRAYMSIVDSNLTTLLVAVILYVIGTGPVQGFAVTLSLGILTSMFTAILGTRALTNLVYGRRNPSKLWI
ncbi:MAG TPA: protein translocase subunit SecD [Porticoccaceae bacterium]|nr:protein translocase subunit SecD [Porticoccaceae bacterium]